MDYEINPVEESSTSYPAPESGNEQEASESMDRQDNSCVTCSFQAIFAFSPRWHNVLKHNGSFN